MNKLTKTDTPTLEALAAEINIIKEQTQKVVIQASIEIGKRLRIAKEQVGHGQWEAWLSTNVDYSQRTASNLIRVYEEYGMGQQKLFGTSINPEAIKKLTYSQAVTLLGIKDADERAEFINESNIDEMSTRELQQAIKEKNELKEQLEKSREKESEAARIREEQLAHIAGLEKELAAAVKESETLKERAATEEVATTDTSALEKELTDSRDEVKELMTQLDKAKKELEEIKETPPEQVVIEKVPENVQAEIESLRKEIADLQNNQVLDIELQRKRDKFADAFQEAQEAFEKLTDTLNALPAEDKEKYGVAVQKLLQKMSEYTEERMSGNEDHI